MCIHSASLIFFKLHKFFAYSIMGNDAQYEFIETVIGIPLLWLISVGCYLSFFAVLSTVMVIFQTPPSTNHSITEIKQINYRRNYLFSIIRILKAEILLQCFLTFKDREIISVPVSKGKRKLCFTVTRKNIICALLTIAFWKFEL